MTERPTSRRTRSTHRPGVVPDAMLRRVSALAMGVLLAASWSALSVNAQAILDAPRAIPWSQVAQWTLHAPSFEGSPFDARGHATFTHLDSGDEVRTGLFYVGDDEWAFRFAATRTGAWRYATSSDEPDLDGIAGDVLVTEGPEGAMGFLRAVDGKLVAPVDDGRGETAVLYNVYMPRTDVLDEIGMLPAAGSERERVIDEVLDEAADLGLPSILVGVYSNWFSFGDVGYHQHDSVDPDLRTFAALEDVILRAREREMFIHIWAWGDESRRMTPVGVGGIGGDADQRLQDYIAARIGPLPGWTMSYGFDLEEWVTPRQVRNWADRLEASSGWPVVLTAREFGSHDGYTFTLDPQRLQMFSTDDRPEDGFYDLARRRLAEANLPVLFERRFLYGRDGVWDQATTRRALWQFTMAGGAGAVWGPSFDDPEPYPAPEQLAIHARFWRDRWTPSLEPAEGFDGWALRTPDGDRWVVYAEDMARLSLPNATDGGEPWTGVAVDARGDRYHEIDLGPIDEAAWNAPYSSDWALALERP